ncbi:resistance to Congo red protein [Stenotrophomonas terrae]|uniref:resistance to Congo red protein n=1 Tax=Stenotrophomonas terrae TaxID=405446 RepID=UPI00128F59D3|nr:resistance to Congo red protein [Stenotrophomonas terrae]
MPRSLLAIALYAASPLAMAMTQCPHESSKSTAFWLLGWAIFALFVIGGVVLMLLIFRTTRHAQRRPRWLLRIASIPAMLALWMLGFGIFLSQFVLVC